MGLAAARVLVVRHRRAVRALEVQTAAVAAVRMPAVVQLVAALLIRLGHHTATLAILCGLDVLNLDKHKASLLDLRQQLRRDGNLAIPAVSAVVGLIQIPAIRVFLILLIHLYSPFLDCLKDNK